MTSSVSTFDYSSSKCQRNSFKHPFLFYDSWICSSQVVHKLSSDGDFFQYLLRHTRFCGDQKKLAQRHFSTQLHRLSHSSPNIFITALKKSGLENGTRVFNQPSSNYDHDIVRRQKTHGVVIHEICDSEIQTPSFKTDILLVWQGNFMFLCPVATLDYRHSNKSAVWSS